MKYNINWNEINRTDHYHTIENSRAPFDNKVVQFGPPRSGTTVVYQILCSLMKESTKTHSEAGVIPFTPDYWIGSCRDPRDTMCSFWRVNHHINESNYETNKIDNKSIDIIFNHYTTNYLNIYESYSKLPNVIWLKYEDYYNNFHYIFDKLEEVMDIKIDLHLRNLLIEEHSISNNKRFSSKHDNFLQHDSSDLSGLHGNHIFSAEPGGWKMIVDEAYHSYMTELCKPYLDAWRYNE